jgi:hypothetical protein
VSMSNPADRVEIITSVQRRRRWTASEKVRIVEETFEPGMTVSLVARRHGVAPNQFFTWRRLVAQGGADGRKSLTSTCPAPGAHSKHSLPSGRYSLLGPDFHRLDRASFAWRTHSITSPASCWRCSGTSRPSVLAVCMLMTNSHLVEDRRC